MEICTNLMKKLFFKLLQCDKLNQKPIKLSYWRNESKEKNKISLLIYISSSKVITKVFLISLFSKLFQKFGNVSLKRICLDPPRWLMAATVFWGVQAHLKKMTQNKLGVLK